VPEVPSGMLLSHEKRELLSHVNMNGPRGHDVKQSKPGTERQTVPEVTHEWNVKELIS
jgi:hypothetical protein